MAPSRECLNAGGGPAEDQGMYVVRAFIGVHRLEVLRMAHDLIFAGYPVAAVHVAGGPGDVERLSATWRLKLAGARIDWQHLPECQTGTIDWHRNASSAALVLPFRVSPAL